MKNKFLVVGLLINLSFILRLFAETEKSDVRISNTQINKSTEFKRHYFNQCNDENLSKVVKGMPRGAVRALAGGKTYVPFETARNGFSFAVDEQHSNFFTFYGWMPKEGVAMDFFFSGERLLFVEYKNDNVEGLRIFPRKSGINKWEPTKK